MKRAVFVCTERAGFDMVYILILYRFRRIEGDPNPNKRLTEIIAFPPKAEELKPF